MPAYAIVLIDVTDRERYSKYTQATPSVIAKFGGRFVVRGGKTATLEGRKEKRRVVVIEFPTFELAQAFYQSEEYQEVKKLRSGAATGTFIVADGCPADPGSGRPVESLPTSVEGERSRIAFTLEPMAESHGRAVIDIFNQFVTSSFAAYPDQPVPHEFFGRFQQMIQGYPAFVAVVPPGRVIGFGFLRPFHHANTLRRTAELTYFILPEFTRRGIGTALLDRLIEQAAPMGIDSLVASISSKNEESIAFHRKNGFRECGRFERAGRKAGQDFDIVWMQRHLGPATSKDSTS